MSSLRNVIKPEVNIIKNDYEFFMVMCEVVDGVFIHVNIVIDASRRDMGSDFAVEIKNNQDSYFFFF
jgi:predicted TIM-barrel enzyme